MMRLKCVGARSVYCAARRASRRCAGIGRPQALAA
jgi:hypothetical protein